MYDNDKQSIRLTETFLTTISRFHKKKKKIVALRVSSNRGSLAGSLLRFELALGDFYTAIPYIRRTIPISSIRTVKKAKYRVACQTYAQSARHPIEKRGPWANANTVGLRNGGEPARGHSGDSPNVGWPTRPPRRRSSIAALAPSDRRPAANGVARPDRDRIFLLLAFGYYTEKRANNETVTYSVPWTHHPRNSPSIFRLETIWWTGLRGTRKSAF